MGTGRLTMQIFTADESLPLANAAITIKDTNGRVLRRLNANANGSTDEVTLTAPDARLSLTPAYPEPAYSVYDVDIAADGYVTEHIHAVAILDGQTAILPVHMLPLVDEPSPVTDNDIYIAPVALLTAAPYRKTGPVVVSERPVVIPDYITVHLGAPTNTSARNVKVKFPEYVKNVASSEIYATWPENALIANIHAIVTFAINRVYTEWYRGRGYYFDITNSTAYDQYFREGAQIYENISRIVDEIFNVYASRFAFRNPFFTQFCNGSTVTCPGLSQWGTVTLANQGMSPIEILRYYYPNDLQLRTSNNITGITESYPGTALTIGSRGGDVLRMQNHLNRIRVNYPLIPQITPDGIFGAQTQEAVRVFQRTFHLAADGVIGRATWNKISAIFVGVTRLAELDSEGERYTIGQNPPNVVLRTGSRGENVIELQFILNTAAAYYPAIPSVIQDGVFGASTNNAVIEFQKNFGLTPDGIVGPATWNKLYAVYRGIEENVLVP